MNRSMKWWCDRLFMLHVPRRTHLLTSNSLRSDDKEPGGPAPDSAYLGSSLLGLTCRRFPWLLSLMLVQSISGWVVERFERLIQRHVILAAFLTMLVGGGGNSSGQTVATLVRALGAGEIRSADFSRVLLRELAVGAMLAVALGACAYPRVRLLSNSATAMDALTISVCYAIIVLMANAIGVVTVMTLHQCDMAAVGSPPVVQVVVDVLGIVVTMFTAEALLGEAEETSSE